jgi:hypothetical protein
MRFEVPQFVDVEDKIIGPFTWKQFIYIAGGAGSAFILYATTPFFIFLFLGIPIGAFSAGLAFYKINNRPLEIMIEAVVTYLGSARLYLWERDTSAIGNVSGSEEKEGAYAHYNAELGHQRSIASLARKLEISALKK